MLRFLILIILLSQIFSAPAAAYVGPGSSLAMLLVVLGVIASVLMGIISFFWYPLKRLLRKLRGKQAEPGAAPEDPPKEETIDKP